MVRKLQQLTEAQFVEADQALIGVGDFVLLPVYARHRLTADVWGKMALAQRRKVSAVCFKLPAKAATSTDGAFVVPLTPGVGKKPHQRKRKRAEKTTTLVRKRLITNRSSSESD